MIYVLVEDSKDGYKLCREIVNHYFKNNMHNIVVKSYMGITKLKNVIEDLFEQISEADEIVVVYDDIIENPIVSTSLEEVNEYTTKVNVHLLPVKSFELEAILIDDIEFTANYNNYKEYIRKIKEAYDKVRDVKYLTKITKEDELYSNMYNQIRKDKAKKNIYKRLTLKEFERAITIESLSKKLLSKMYDKCTITKPMGDCWVKSCCYRTKNNKCSPFLNHEKMIKIEYALLMVIISNTEYKKLVKLLGKLLNIKIQVQSLKIEDLLNKEVMYSCHINKCIEEERL